MRPIAFVILVLSFLVLNISSILADDFTAVMDGGWKDPATWGRSGYPRDGMIPGIMVGRLDTVIIPSGITVYYEGDYHSLGAKGAKSGGSLTTIDVDGKVKGKRETTPINLKATEDINVLPSGEVGGSWSPGVPENPITIQADSNVSVQGTVNGKGGKVTITAGKNFIVGSGGTVQSDSTGVKIRAKKGKIVVAAGGKVKAGTTVRLRPNTYQNVEIMGNVEAGKDIIINQEYYSGQCGNVVIGPQGGLKAPEGEIRITADTLRVQGKIEGDTVQKTIRVLIIEGNGSIVQHGKKSKKITNKVLDKWKAEQREKQEAAEWAEKIKALGDGYIVMDISSANGTILGAEESILVAGGIGGTLDLTGNPPGTPVMDCLGPIEIFMDEILLDPGVLVEDLCGPGPVTVGPSGPTFDPVCIADSDTVAYPGHPGEIRFLVANMGFDPEVYEFVWDDSLGWGPMPALPPVLLGGATDPAETVFVIPFDTPPWAIPGVDTNRVRLTVRSTTDPSKDYSETAILPVRGIATLKDIHVAVWGVNPAPGGAVMGVEHWLANNGSLDDSYAVTVTNSESWPILPYPPDVFIPAEEDFLFMTEMEIPFGTPDGFPNEVYFTVESMTSPGVTYTDTVLIHVNVVTAAPLALPPAGVISHRVHPNPFNPKVVISFAVPAPGDHATVTVYDVNGRRVRRVFDGAVGAADGECSWDGTDTAGRPVSSGVYFYRITAGGQEATGKMILAK